MNQVDFITFCCPKDIRRLGAPNELSERVKSHDFPFHEVHVIRQRCGTDFEDVTFSSPYFAVTEWRSEDFPGILGEYRVPENDEASEKFTHGPAAAHYWKWHVINHLIGLKVSTADYVVFSDCDCRIASQVSSWVIKAIKVLQQYPQVLIVSPGDGGHMNDGGTHNGVRFTQNVSQQLFMCERKRLRNIDFNCAWNWEVLAPGGPMQEYYYMLEGRIWRYMNDKDLQRAVLPDEWRYWHDGWH
jgi:hypothetical protein